jgi:hypothetical protein
LKWATVMTAYKQFATTAYDRQNFSIVDIRTTADPEPMPLSASDYMTIFQKIFVPTNFSAATDRSGIDALVYSITWLHRTYRGSFPDDQNSLVTNLHNLLSIPLQFTVTAVQFANYTTSLNFSMPADTMTTATSGWSASKLVIQLWTGWLFIGSAAALLIVVLVGIGWILSLRTPLPRASGIGDLDTLRLAGRIRTKKSATRQGQPNMDRGGSEEMPLMDFTQIEEVADKDSAWKLAKEIWGWRVVADDVECKALDVAAGGETLALANSARDSRPPKYTES